jgi:hypothetical protein
LEGKIRCGFNVEEKGKNRKVIYRRLFKEWTYVPEEGNISGRRDKGAHTGLYVSVHFTRFAGETSSADIFSTPKSLLLSPLATAAAAAAAATRPPRYHFQLPLPRLLCISFIYPTNMNADRR